MVVIASQTRLFIQQIVNNKTPHHWPFVRGPVDHPYKGPVMWRAFPGHDAKMLHGDNWLRVYYGCLWVNNALNKSWIYIWLWVSLNLTIFGLQGYVSPCHSRCQNKATRRGNVNSVTVSRHIPNHRHRPTRRGGLCHRQYAFRWCCKSAFQGLLKRWNSRPSRVPTMHCILSWSSAVSGTPDL